MSEMKRARLNNTDEIISVDMGEPTRAAKLFKYISDSIWEQRKSDDLTVAWTPRDLKVKDLDELNETLPSIQEKLVLAGEAASGELHIPNPHGGDGLWLASHDMVPIGGGVDTFNWDERMSQGVLGFNEKRGRYDSAHWTDGPTWYRELGVQFEFRVPEGGSVRLRYALQRLQEQQDEPTAVYANLWYSGYAETGYEGRGVGRADLTDEQEIRLLRTIARLGGVGLKSV